MMTSKWVKRWMDTAKHYASWSKDTTQVGAVAVRHPHVQVSQGYNGLARGVQDRPERMERPIKYLWTAHAEENVVSHAARAVLEGTTVFVTHLCCARCARMLINAGVAEVIVGDGKTSMPEEEFTTAKTMLEESGVRLRYVDG